MVLIRFTPEPLISCQKLDWLRRMGCFQAVEKDEDITFNWNWTGTKFKPMLGAVNGSCTDTSKAFVDHCFSKVYGYSSAAGPDDRIAVEKSNGTNGAKDCRFIEKFDGYNKKPGHFYQKYLVDCGDEITEHRFVIMDWQPVICLVKKKAITRNNIPGKVTRYLFAEVPSRALKMALFCEMFGMQYGELDLIYYRGMPYIIDCNPTPGDAAWVNMPSDLAERYINEYKTHFMRWIRSLS